MAQILYLQGMILPKFTTFGLLIPILGTSTIMDQADCCYAMTTMESRCHNN